MRLRRHKPPPMRSKARPRPTATTPRRHRARKRPVGTGFFEKKTGQDLPNPDQQLSVVELPGIEPACLPGNLLAERQFHSASFRFSPARYLRLRSRVLTASRAVTHRRELPVHPPGVAGIT